MPSAVPMAMAVALVLVPLRAIAAASLSAVAEGSCPDRHGLTAALLAKGFIVVPEGAPFDYQAVVQSAPNGASMVLRRSVGEVLVERRFSSPDCRALAEAMSVVIEAYFIEVGVLTRRMPADAVPNPAVSVPASELPQSATAPPAAPVPFEQGTSEQDLNPSSRATAKLPPAAPIQTPKKPLGVLLKPGTVRPVPSRSSLGEPAMHPRGLLGIGPQLVLPKGTVLPVLELGAGLEFPKIPLSTEVILNANLLSTTDSFGPDRVRRWASQGLLRVGYPWKPGINYRPWAGIGLTMASLRDLELSPATSKISLRAVVAAGFEVAWPIGKDWLGRGDLGCSVLTTRDSYRIDEAEIGRGPSVVCATMLGVALGRTPGQSDPATR